MVLQLTKIQNMMAWDALQTGLRLISRIRPCQLFLSVPNKSGPSPASEVPDHSNVEPGVGLVNGPWVLKVAGTHGASGVSAVGGGSGRVDEAPASQGRLRVLHFNRDDAIAFIVRAEQVHLVGPQLSPSKPKKLVRTTSNT